MSAILQIDKTMRKKLIITLVGIIMTMNLTSCTLKPVDQTENAPSTLYPIKYTHVYELDNAGVEKFTGETSTNMPTDYGVIISPFYKLTINGKEIPVYAARSANGIHSFAYIDVESAGKFALNVKITPSENAKEIKKDRASVTVLPQRSGVTAEIKDGSAVATIASYGSFSFVFNRSHVEPLTLMVKEKETFNANGRNVKYFEPGEYAIDKTTFTEANTVYYFKAGAYEIDSIILPTNSTLYLEAGAYIKVIPNATSKNFAIRAADCENITVEGRGLLDFSACCGGQVPEGYENNKQGVVFDRIKNITVKGIIIINSQTWTLCFNDCENITVRDVMFFAYRVFADGIMLSDCRNAVVENNFIRTGDDAFETKSTTTTGRTDNVLFENNAAWTDKAVAYGCIYESNHDTQNVTFKNNSVGFALGTWSEHLGCNVIQMGSNKVAKMYDINFIGTEIFVTYNAMCNIYIGGSGGVGEGWGKVKDIYFRDINAVKNYSFVLNVRTYETQYSEIKNIYLDNITSNGIAITRDNYFKYFQNFAANFNPDTMLHINTRTDI